MSAIIVENLSKCYQIGRQVRHDTLRDAVMHTLGGLIPGRRKDRQAEAEDFWALRDVSFKVEPGEVVGIIGRNGAGKSTLLKILSRITEPTQGRIKINGRVASLLEVGTGFHPELTGRDNIYLNGAILGMSRVEIRKKFDEIVAFAEVEQFLDTPVKRYSSGMYVRLAFAVAAYLEPEILIVDEVLAVGDAQFQSKCLGKIKQVARENGRTVLFVSHNLSVIQSVCRRCLLLKAGRIAHDAPASAAVAEYLQSPGGETWIRTQPETSSCHFRRANIRIEASDTNEWIALISIDVFCPVERKTALEVTLHDTGGQNIALGLTGATEQIPLRVGIQTITSYFPLTRLAIGRYGLSLKLMIPGIEMIDEIPNALAFDFHAPPPENHSYRLVQSWGNGSFMLDLKRL